MTSALRNPVRAFWRSISSYTNRAPIPFEQKDRLQHYTIFLLLGVPALIAFGVYNIVSPNYPLFLLILACTLGLVLGWLILHRVQNGQNIYRINSFLYGCLVLYMLAIGGEAGSKILWMYTYPLFIFFLLGAKEGLLWIFCSLLIAAVMLLDPLNTIGVFSYHGAFKLRFFTTFIIVSFIAFWFQYLRHSYFVKMEDRQAKLEQERQRLEKEVLERQRAERDKEAVIQELQTALDEVKTLSGMIPICASCHKIRDDEGFWDQIESYVARHSEAQFSHGICPACMDKLYPGYKKTTRPE